MEFFRLSVTNVVKEAKSTKSLLLNLPLALAKTFEWQAGQYVNVRVQINNKAYIRSYSISNDAQTQGIRLTIKSVDQGLVSNYLLSTIKAGQSIEVSRPCGRFSVKPNSADNKCYYFFAAGSGITPIYSMITTILQQEPNSQIALLYSSRNKKSIIFDQALNHLQQRYSTKFRIAHVLTKPGWFSGDKAWQTGRINSAIIERFLREYRLVNTVKAQANNAADETSYYLCGPSGFMQTVNSVLVANKVNSEAIYQESFGNNNATSTNTKPANVTSRAATLIVDSEAGKNTIQVNSNETLLAAMQRNNIDVAYSCLEGVCGSCQCQLLSGKVNMLDNLFLTEEEQARGLILSCQALAQTSQLAIKLE
ncbi:FAD-binding oxidoreductase [Colwellia sp. MEBiC06753]